MSDDIKTRTLAEARYWVNQLKMQRDDLRAKLAVETELTRLTQQTRDAAVARAEKAEAALDQTPYDWRVMRNQAMKAEAERDDLRAKLAAAKEDVQMQLEVTAKRAAERDAALARVRELELMRPVPMNQTEAFDAGVAESQARITELEGALRELLNRVSCACEGPSGACHHNWEEYDRARRVLEETK